MQKPLVTVLIPTFNRASYLKQAIDSVLKQTFTDFEILVLDNCSTDDTEALIAGYSDYRIKYHKNSSNIGIIGNHNKGLSLSQGDYIHLFSDDDVMSSEENLACKVAIMEQHPSVGIVHSSIYTINGEGTVIGDNWASTHADWPTITASPLMPGRQAFDILYYKWNFINMPAALLRKSLITDYGLLFNNKLKYLLDWDLWFYMCLLGDVYYIDKQLISYRVHDKNITKLMIHDTYYREMLTIKTGLASFFGDRFPFVKTDMVTVENSTRSQMGIADPKLTTRVVSKAKSTVRKVINTFSK